MPEEIKQDATAPVTSHETVVNTSLTTETLDQNGKSIPHNANLSAIFDKIESGVKNTDAVSEVMSKEKPSKDSEKEVSVTSSHPEKKQNKEAENLEDAFADEQSRKSDAAEPQSQKDEDKKTSDDVSEDELKVLPHDKPKTAKRISALLQKVAKVTEEVVSTRKEKEERDARIKEIEAKLNEVKTVDPKTEDEVQSKLKELNMFRRRYELDKDPEVKSRFDSRIEQADSAIPEILKRNSAGDGLLNLIKEEGGWSSFSKSSRIITLADGNKVTSAELADQIVSALPFSDRKSVDSLTMEQISVKREKDRFLQDEIKAADEFFKKREEESGRSSEAQKKQIKEAQETIAKWQAKVEVENAFLNEKEVPADAAPEVKKEIEEENSHARSLNEKLLKNLQVKDMDGMLSVVLEAVQFHQEKREKAKLLTRLQKVEAELKAKSDELDKFKTSGKTTPRSGSLTGGGSSPAQSSSKKPVTIEDAFAALESGRAED